VSAALRVRGLSAAYGGFRVLDAIDLDVAAGSLTVIVGSNGAGKTTLLKSLAGLMARGGEIALDDTTLPAQQPTQAVRAGLALVPEGRQLFPQMTVRENLELGGWLLHRAERPERLRAILNLFPLLHERQAQRAGTMSGGEQQMLAVARALVNRPRLIMLDEPSLGLAPRMVAELLSIIRRIRDHGVTVLLVEQNVAKALAIADHAYVLERGRIVAHGAGRELLASDRIRAAYLGASA
jgi:branched-chain amino acid transport system ATP-binding protein